MKKSIAVEASTCQNAIRAVRQHLNVSLADSKIDRMYYAGRTLVMELTNNVRVEAFIRPALSTANILA